MIRQTALALACVLALGCAGPKKGEVSYEDPSKVETVTMELGSTDVEMAAKKLNDKLARYTFPAKETARYGDGKVRLRVRKIENRTSEHFDVVILTNRLMEVMGECEKIICVVETRNQQDMRQEKADMEVHGDPSTTGAAAAGEIAPNYILQGDITAISKRNEDTRMTDYNFSLKVTHVNGELTMPVVNQPIRKTRAR